MRGILIVFVAISAILGIVLMGLSVRDGGFERAGGAIDRQVDLAGADAKRAVEQVGDAIKRTTEN